MEIHQALEFCLRRLQTEPEHLLRLALSLGAPAKDAAQPEPLLSAPGPGVSTPKTNHAILQTSQEVLAETILRLDRDNS